MKIFNTDLEKKRFTNVSLSLYVKRLEEHFTRIEKRTKNKKSEHKKLNCTSILDHIITEWIN